MRMIQRAGYNRSSFLRVHRSRLRVSTKALYLRVSISPKMFHVCQVCLHAISLFFVGLAVSVCRVELLTILGMKWSLDMDKGKQVDKGYIYPMGPLWDGKNLLEDRAPAA